MAQVTRINSRSQTLRSDPGSDRDDVAEQRASMAQPEGRSCVHHWVLGDPSSGVVPARCKRCGADRGFPAQPEGTDRFDDYRELTESSTYHVRRTSQ